MSVVNVLYIGKKPTKFDNIAGTGKTWRKGESIPVEAAAAAKLLQHPDIWVNAETYNGKPPQEANGQGGDGDSLLGELLGRAHIIVVSEETLAALRAGHAVVDVHPVANPADNTKLETARTALADVTRGQNSPDATPAQPDPAAAAAENTGGQASAPGGWDFDKLSKNEIAKRLKDEYGVEVNADKFNKAELVEYASNVITAKQQKAA